MTKYKKLYFSFIWQLLFWANTSRQYIYLCAISLLSMSIRRSSTFFYKVILTVLILLSITAYNLYASSSTNRKLNRNQHLALFGNNVHNETELVNNDNEAFFKAGPMMNTPRMEHHYTMLSNGNVAIFGGHTTNFVSLSTAEIWTPDTESFITLNMNYTHSWAIFDRLNDGTLLLAGGCADWGIPRYATSEIFNPADNSFTVISDMVRFRAGTGSAVMNDGRVLIAGGWWTHNDAHTYGELFNPQTGSFSEVGPFEAVRALTIVMPTSDGGAVVLGGRTPRGNREEMPIEYVEPVEGVITTLHDNLIINDQDWYVTNDWTRPSFMQIMPNGKYLWLGHDLDSDNNVTSYLLFTFDPQTKDIEQFVTKPPLPTSKEAIFYRHPVIDLKRNRAHLLATIPERDTKSTIAVFSIELENGSLTRSSNNYEMDYYLGGAGAVVLEDGRLFVTGGTSDASNFNPVTNTVLITPPEQETSVEVMDPRTVTILMENYPNPFNPETVIGFILEEPREVIIDIFNLRGQRIKPLVNESFFAGEHKIVWNGRNDLDEIVPSGIYYYRMKTKDFNMAKKMILLK